MSNEIKFDINEFKVEYLVEYMRKNNYDESSIDNYASYFNRFINFFSKNAFVSLKDIRDYILTLIIINKYKESSQNQVINVLKLYFENVLKFETDPVNFPRPRRGIQNPTIITESEVTKLLKATSDLKYRAIFSLVYSSGLRTSEIKYLKLSDIDSIDMRIFVSSKDGKKDRYIFLSFKILTILREYYRKYEPNYWLFEESSGKQINVRKLQSALANSVKVSEIKKRVTLTILRNSFIVHLMEQGVDVRFIKKVLGHSNIKTTLRFLRVSKQEINKITSPFDRLTL